MTSRIKFGLPLSLGIIVLTIEAIVLLFLGTRFLGRFSAEVDRRLQDSIAKPSLLVAQGALSTDAFGQRDTLENLVGPALDDALIVTASGTVLVALDPEAIGQSWERTAPRSRDWLKRAAVGGFTERITEGSNSFLIRVAPVNVAAGQAPALFDYVRLRTTESEGELAALRWFIFGGSLAAFLATTIALLIAAHLLVTRRLQAVGEAVRQVTEGRYETRMPEGAWRDEITFLASAFNTMTGRLREAFARLQSAMREAEAAEQKYRVLVENAAEAIFVAQEGQLVFTNPQCCKLLACTPEEALKSPITRFVHPDDQGMIAERHAQRLRGETPPNRYQFRLLTCDGRRLRVELSVVRIEWKDAPASLNFLTDITERHRAEQELKHVSAFRQVLLEKVNEGLCLCHEIAEEPCVQFTMWNPHMTEITGYTLEEINTRGWYQSLYPDPAIRTRAIERMARMRTGDNLTDEPWEIVRADGAQRTLAISTSLIESADGAFHVLGLMRDVTERRRAEEAIRLSQAQLLASLESTPNVAIQWYDEAGKVLYWNPASERLYGWKSGEALGKTLDQLIHTPEEAAAFLKLLATIKQSGQPIAPYEAPVRRADGSRGWVLATTFSIPLGGGRPGYVCMDMDITDRKQAEHDREQLQAQLIQAQKMESVGRLAGGVAHDFNNMLQAIIGNVDLALALAPPDPAIRECLAEINNSARRSAELTRQLLAFARKQSVTPKVVNLNALITELLVMLRRLLGEHVELDYRAGADLWNTQIDPSQVDQVLTNLCINARDAISSSGQIGIETANVRFDETHAALYPGNSPGDYVVLRVSDTGAGMDAATRAQIFEPFFTTKAVGKGTGLGLATVFGIVKQNGGLIHVDSEPGKGTTFSIYLPRSLAGPAPAEPAVALAKATGRETILLVEDEPQVLNLGRRILARNGYHVLGAANPEIALELAAQHGPGIQLLITDVIMPGMNGRLLRDHLRQQYPTLKCLFMSGYTADVVGQHGILDDGIDFVQKPFTIDIFCTKVREILDS